MSKINTKLKGRQIPCENYFCEDMGKCKKYATDHHHQFPNTKFNRKIYADLLDCDFNILNINGDCHLTKVIPRLTEIEFRAKAFDNGYELLPTSKTLSMKRF